MPGLSELEENILFCVRIASHDHHQVVPLHVQIPPVILRGVLHHNLFGGKADAQPLLLLQIGVNRIPAGPQGKVGHHAPLKVIVVHNHPLSLNLPHPEQVVDLLLLVVLENIHDPLRIGQDLQIFHLRLRPAV